MTKRALLFGCGSKWGLEFTKYLSANGYQVDLVSSSSVDYPNVKTLNINWVMSNENSIKELLVKEEYDLIFFNQNSGGGPGSEDFSPSRDYSIDHWNIHNWINCQLPYTVIKHLSSTITEKTKIGWMLTGLIVGNDTSRYQYAGYASIKSTNLHIMRGFSEFHKGIFFAINPIWFPVEDYKKDAEQISNVIEQLEAKDSGKSFMKDGSFWL
jgi:hypothetical protein